MNSTGLSASSRTGVFPSSASVTIHSPSNFCSSSGMPPVVLLGFGSPIAGRSVNWLARIQPDYFSPSTSKVQ